MEFVGEHPKSEPPAPALTINCPDCRGLGVISCESCTSLDVIARHQRILLEHCPKEELHRDDARAVDCPACKGTGEIPQGRSGNARGFDFRKLEKHLRSAR